MPLTNVRIAPGFNKADTPSGAEGQWIDGDSLFVGLELHPFWQYQIRECPAC